MKTLPIALALGLSAFALSGCEKDIQARNDTGVCFHVIPQKGGELKYNVVARNLPSIERCAAELEGMRLRFARMGGPQEILGAYQGSFLHFQREGIFRSTDLNGVRYLMLVRTGDGRLAIPGAMPMQ
jgi:hypothetical protein